MIKALVQEWWQELVEDPYSRYATLILLIVVLVWGGRQGYDQYIAYRERKAQLVMSEAFEEFDKALYYKLEGKDSSEILEQRFEDAQIAFDAALQGNSSSDLYSYALAFQADISVQRGDKENAITLLEKSIASMNKKTPGYYFIKTKLALVSIDAGKVDQGLKDLEALARDAENLTFDTAAFYAGYYYWLQKDVQKAQELWLLLKPSDKTSKRGISPWWALAQEQLQQVTQTV